MKRVMRTGDTIWKQIYQEQHGEDKDIEHHRGLVELFKNHRDAFLSPGGRLASERQIHFHVRGNLIESWNTGFPWVNINDFEIVGRDSKAEKGSRYDNEESVSGKEVGRLQIFRLARRLSDGKRDFHVEFHCKNIDGKESSVRVFNWNENDGSYEVELLDKVVKGTHWFIKCESNIDIVELKEYLEDQLRYFDTPIYYNFNGTEEHHTPPGKKGVGIYYKKKLTLSNNVGTAYINDYGSGTFTVYNQGIKLRTPLDTGVGGISGTIITTKFLPEDLGRGSLIQSDELVSKMLTELKFYGIQRLTDKIKRMKSADLTENERNFLLRRARYDSDLRSQIETRHLIPRGNESYTCIANIVQMVGNGKPLYWATDNTITNDKALQIGMNVVAHSSDVESLLERYGVHGANLDTLETVRQWEHGYNLVETDQASAEFFKDLIEWMFIGMRKGIDSQENPTLRVGKCDSTCINGWTNSKEYIAFSKNSAEEYFIKERDAYLKLQSPLDKLEFLRHTETLTTLMHEVAHWGKGDDSITISTHGDEFKDALLKVNFAVLSEMDAKIKEMLKEEEPRLAEWTTKVKTRPGSDGKPLFALSIPREQVEKLGLTENSIVKVVLKTATEMGENYSKRGYSAKTDKGEEE